MLDLTRLPLFLTASLALLLAPGPAVLYIIARSLDQGRRAGLVSVLSIEAGNFMHVLMAALGLSALLLSSPAVFLAVKYLGAAYLIYLGVRKLLSLKSYAKNSAALPPSAALPLSHASIFRQGFVVAVLNPKTALFFLAFLPQFVSPGRGSIPAQFFALGSIFVLMAFFTDSLYALLAGSAAAWLKQRRGFALLEGYFAGAVFIGLGLIAVLEELLG